MAEAGEKFEAWAIVEVMGHQRYSGLVSEQVIGGCAFVRVDVPAMDGCEAFTKLLGQSAIFCITPVSEEVARRAAANSMSRPVNTWDIRQPEQPALTHAGDSDDEDECDLNDVPY